MLIHKMRLDDYKAVLDVNSGAVHLVDDLIYDLLDVFNGENGEEAINAMKDRYNEAELREAVEELTELKNEGLLFSPEFEVPPTFSNSTFERNLDYVMPAYCARLQPALRLLLCRYRRFWRLPRSDEQRSCRKSS